RNLRHYSIEPTASSRHPRETPNDFDQLVMPNATRVAKFVDPMSVREPIQAHEPTNVLASAQLQIGVPIGEQEAPHSVGPESWLNSDVVTPALCLPSSIAISRMF